MVGGDQYGGSLRGPFDGRAAAGAALVPEAGKPQGSFLQVVAHVPLERIPDIVVHLNRRGEQGGVASLKHGLLQFLEGVPQVGAALGVHQNLPPGIVVGVGGLKGRPDGEPEKGGGDTQRGHGRAL